ncbi:unnamed protein product [Durusdinium trenchii]
MEMLKAAAAIAFLLVLPGLPWLIISQLQFPVAEDCEAIIILGYEIDWISGDVLPGGLLEARLQLAQRTAEQSRPRWLILSGGVGQKGEEFAANSEAVAMQRWLQGKAVCWDEVLLEDASQSTRTNAIQSLDLLQKMAGEHFPEQVCVATNAFHRFRAWRSFLHVQLEAKIPTKFTIKMLHEASRTLPRSSLEAEECFQA